MAEFMRHGIFDLKQFSLCAFLRTTLAAWDQVCLSARLGVRCLWSRRSGICL